MIILASDNKTGVSIVTHPINISKGEKRYYAQAKGGYFDPMNSFKPCMWTGEGEDIRRRLWDGGVSAYEGMIPTASETFDKLASTSIFSGGGAEPKKEKKQEQKEAPPSVLSGRIEELMVKALAEASAPEILKQAQPLIQEHIKETYGALPEIHVVQTERKEIKIEGAVHESFDTVLQIVAQDIPVFLSGAAGTGKNVICQQVAKALDLEFYFSNAVTQEHKITGFIDANGNYHDTQFYKAFTNGGLFMLDEMDASIPEVLIVLNAAIANRYFDFPTGRVDAHEDFRLIAAGNTFGTGADIEYSGRYQLDAASLDRFALIEIDYSPNIELAVSNNDEELCKFIRTFRRALNNASIKHLATYRCIDRIAKLKDILNLDSVIRMCLTKSLRKDDLIIIRDKMRDIEGNEYYNAYKYVCDNTEG